MIMNQNNPR